MKSDVVLAYHPITDCIYTSFEISSLWYFSYGCIRSLWVHRGVVHTEFLRPLCIKNNYGKCWTKNIVISYLLLGGCYFFVWHKNISKRFQCSFCIISLSSRWKKINQKCCIKYIISSKGTGLVLESRYPLSPSSTPSREIGSENPL